MCIFNAVKKQSGIGLIVDALFGYFAYLHSLYTVAELHTNFAYLHSIYTVVELPFNTVGLLFAWCRQR